MFARDKRSERDYQRQNGDMAYRYGMGRESAQLLLLAPKSLRLRLCRQLEQ